VSYREKERLFDPRLIRVPTLISIGVSVLNFSVFVSRQLENAMTMIATRKIDNGAFILSCMIAKVLEDQKLFCPVLGSNRT